MASSFNESPRLSYHREWAKSAVWHAWICHSVPDNVVTAHIDAAIACIAAITAHTRTFEPTCQVQTKPRSRFYGESWTTAWKIGNPSYLLVDSALLFIMVLIKKIKCWLIQNEIVVCRILRNNTCDSIMVKWESLKERGPGFNSWRSLVVL